jgi:hypothetical protein
MKFFRLNRGADPVIEFTGVLYNKRVFGDETEPPKPGKGYGRVTDSGKKWHDCLETTHFPHGVFVFSERVAIGVQKAGLKGIKFFPVEFEHNENPRLNLEDAPAYYWGLFTGEIGFNESAGKSRPVYELMTSTSDGSDFVALKGKKMGFRFVSEHFVELVFKSKWTGFQFENLKDGRILDLNIFQPPIKSP